MGKGASSEKVVREIQRRTRRRFSAEDRPISDFRTSLFYPRSRGSQTRSRMPRATMRERDATGDCAVGRYWP
jgi:hypothetical protein